MLKKLLFTWGSLTLLLALIFSFAAAESPNVELKNDYIRIVVNNRETNQGRFAVGTTGGDPDRDTDRNKHLIYGGDNPWTSYTTVRVDKDNWIFGGPTDKRAGLDEHYGEIIQAPVIEDNSIISSWQLGHIKVTQILSFTRGITTALMDTARIEYHLENTDSISHFVGLRLMLDTMLGSNDGAPFSVEDRQVLSDTEYRGAEIPQFWQAFDSLRDPQVISQGTLTGPGLTAPDRVYFSNWGSLADYPWDFDFYPGRDFIRLGEFDPDSAIAVFWDAEAPLAPGEARSYVSYYGLGGLTIVPGEITVAVTSPKRITYDPDHLQTHSFVAHVQNDGEGTAVDVTAELKLPEGLVLAGGSPLQSLGDLDVGQIKATGWQVRADGAIDGVVTYEVEVKAENSESNLAKAQIEIVEPADLKVYLSGPPSLQIKDERYDPPVFEVKAVVRNEGGSASEGYPFELSHPLLELVQGQRSKKFPGPIEPGEEVVWVWLLKPGASGNRHYSVSEGSDEELKPALDRDSTFVPELTEKVWVGKPEFSSDVLCAGDYFSLPVWATNIREFFRVKLELAFDPQMLEVAGRSYGISQGTLFIDSGSSWEMPGVDNNLGLISNFQARRPASKPLDSAYGTLLTIQFRAKQAGEAKISLKNVKVWDEQGKELQVQAEDRDLYIQP